MVNPNLRHEHTYGYIHHVDSLSGARSAIVDLALDVLSKEIYFVGSFVLQIIKIRKIH